MNGLPRAEVEGRVIRTKPDLSHSVGEVGGDGDGSFVRYERSRRSDRQGEITLSTSPVEGQQGLCGSTVSYVGMGGDGDCRSTCFERSRRPGRQGDDVLESTSRVKDNGVLLPSRVLGWTGVVTIGPPVVVDLEGRVFRTKKHLSLPPVSKDNRVLCWSTVSHVGMDRGGGHRSVRCGRS